MDLVAAEGGEESGVQSGGSWVRRLDPSSGRFFYLHLPSGLSTWDRPAGVEPPLATDSLPFVERSEDSDRARRSEYIGRVFEERRELARLRAEQKEQDEFRRRLEVWTGAMERAKGSADDLSLSWTPFGYIDPCVYTYQELYGRSLVTLRLIGLALKSLPDEVGFKLTSLRVLNLSSNEIEALPESLLRLTNLQELHLGHNKLLRLPERIGLMGCLHRLELANNQLTRLPVTLAGLTRMERLDAESNRLQVLPENLDAMRSCKTLNFNHNELVRLPRCLGRLPSLQALSASWNNITYIPEELCSSRSLRHIRLNLNLISLIPEKIGLMSQLQELSLDSNRITGLPMSFFQLSSLRVLRIENNPNLLNPPATVIEGGAVRVVAWCLERYKENESARMRYIVRAMIELLTQIEGRGIADPAYFEPNVLVKNDYWFALQWEYLWEQLLPQLEGVWYRELMQGLHDPTKTFSFAFSRTDVDWAFKHFQDAYGPMLMRQRVDFRRCACKDSDGKRKPCVPPSMSAIISFPFKNNSRIRDGIYVLSHVHFGQVEGGSAIREGK